MTPQKRTAYIRSMWVGAAALMCSACGDVSGEPPGTLGELGEGTFRYSCIDDGDPVCNIGTAVDASVVQRDLGRNGEIPAAVAVGARFDITYQGTVVHDGDPLLVETQPARSDDVSKRGGFAILEPGSYAFLARSPKGVVADFTYIDASEVAELEVWHDQRRITSLTLEPGGEAALAITPSDEQGIALAGALEYTWESSDTAVLVLDSADSIGTPTSGIELGDDEVRLVAAGEGQATLTISAGELTKTLDITVLPEVMP